MAKGGQTIAVKGNSKRLLTGRAKQVKGKLFFQAESAFPRSDERTFHVRMLNSSGKWDLGSGGEGISGR